MKKILAVLLSAVLCVGVLAGCNGNDKKNNPSSSTSTSQSSSDKSSSDKTGSDSSDQDKNGISGTNEPQDPEKAPVEDSSDSSLDDSSSR